MLNHYYYYNSLDGGGYIDEEYGYWGIIWGGNIPISGWIIFLFRNTVLGFDSNSS